MSFCEKRHEPAHLIELFVDQWCAQHNQGHVLAARDSYWSGHRLVIDDLGEQAIRLHPEDRLPISPSQKTRQVLR